MRLDRLIQLPAPPPPGPPEQDPPAILDEPHVIIIPMDGPGDPSPNVYEVEL